MKKTVFGIALATMIVVAMVALSSCATQQLQEGDFLWIRSRDGNSAIISSYADNDPFTNTGIACY